MRNLGTVNISQWQALAARLLDPTRLRCKRREIGPGIEGPRCQLQPYFYALTKGSFVAVFLKYNLARVVLGYSRIGHCMVRPLKGTNFRRTTFVGVPWAFDVSDGLWERYR